MVTANETLESFLKENKEHHYNFEDEITYKVSSGSLKFDYELNGGFGPGLHRFTGINEGGKTSEALEVMKKYNADMSNASEEDKQIFHAADGKAEYDKCVEISTQASIREMILPGLLAIIVPVLIGFSPGGAEMLGGLLAGVTVTGVLMAIFQSNSGGAWDNAKKMIEEQGGKGTDAHKAAVVGDTVGDPFKDTSGPSLNILIKLISVVALVITPLL